MIASADIIVKVVLEVVPIYFALFYMLSWERGRRYNRRYWEYLRLSDEGRQTLTRCPAATGGYLTERYGV